MTFIELFQKAVQDELTASIVYIKMAKSLKGFDGTVVAEHLVEHADEEYEHYKKLIDFAEKHGYIDQIDFTKIDKDVINNAPLGDEMKAILYTGLKQREVTVYKPDAVFNDYSKLQALVEKL